MLTQQKGVDFTGKDLKGRELGVGICQRKDGLYTARFVSKRTGKSVQRYFPKLQECRNWYADARFEDEHGGINACGDMTVTAWFEYWLENIKGDSIRPNTIRNYRERFEHNIKDCIGSMILSDVKPMHCQNVLNQMKDNYRTSTIYQTRIALYCMFSDAVENDVILKNPVTKAVKYNIGKEPKKVCVCSLFCVIGNFVPITQQRSEKNEQRELEIPGGYFGRNVVIYVRMRTK